MVRVLPSLTWGETVEYGEDLVEREGLYYKKSSDISFTGKVTGEQQGKFKHGKHHGPWTYYWENGQFLSNGTYKDGKRVGPWFDDFKNGTVDEKYTGTFKDGVKVK